MSDWSEFCYTFERLDADCDEKRFVNLTEREFEIFFSGPDHMKARKALAWNEFHHSVGGRMIKVRTQKREPCE